MSHRRRRGSVAAFLGWAIMAGACGLGAGEAGTTTTTLVGSTAPATTTSEPAATSTTRPGGRNQYGGEVVIGELDEPISLNPFVAGRGGAAERIGQAYLTGVADVDGFSLELVPDVVVELPTVANGGLVVNEDGTETVILEIDPLAVWADGTPISGEDFRFTYETLMTPGYAVDRSGYEDIIPDSLVVGAKSFEFTLARPSLVVESLFGVVLPAHVVGGTDLMLDWNDRIWVSGGPFVLEQWSPGEFLTLRRNEAYWKVDGETGQGLPYLDRVVVRFLGDVEELVAEFLERRLDVVSPGVELGVLDGLVGVPGVVVDVVGDGQWEHLAFQLGDGRLVRNPDSYNEHIEFRRAVALAVDRDALAAALTGGWGEGLDTFVEAFTPGWAGEGWGRYDFDPDAAREQLALLCAKPGVDCQASPPTVVYTSAEQRSAVAEALEPMLTAVGIEFRAELEPRVVFLGETIEFGTFDVGQWSWSGRPGLAALACINRMWDPRQAPPVGTNYYRFGSPAFSGTGELSGYQEGPSSLINEATVRVEEISVALGVNDGCLPTTIDRTELLTLIAEAEEILADQVPFIPLYQGVVAGVVWGDEIAGYKPNPAGGGDTWNIGYWHRIDGGGS